MKNKAIAGRAPYTLPRLESDRDTVTRWEIPGEHCGLIDDYAAATGKDARSRRPNIDRQIIRNQTEQ